MCPTSKPGDLTPDPGPDAAGGANHFDVYTGGMSRAITDLYVYGGVGDLRLKFQRTTTSRYLGGVPTPLGSGGSWRHNYLWNIYSAGNNALGNEIIVVDYPDGNNWRFDKKNASDPYLTAVSETQDRVQQDPSDLTRYSLYFVDGSRLLFLRGGTAASPTYQAQGLFDKYGLYYPFTLDAKGRVTRVTEPAGRWINFTYGPVGNFGVANVAFSYNNASAANVYLAGDFNAWSTSANPMVKDAQGNWRTTIPLQLGTWQYKFIVDGIYTADPNNPYHIPTGANNNSGVIVHNNDQGTSTSQPTPVGFAYANDSANAVFIAGDFNGWSTSANPMSKSGSNWTATVNIPNGAHLYKLVVDGAYITDPGNPFTAPDGYGGNNSKLAVGPYDEAITMAQTSDGRSATYAYVASSSFGSIYSALTQVNYGDGTAAHYSYGVPFAAGGRPIIASADDPRYTGSATRVAYTYQNTSDDGAPVDGFIYQEKSLVTGSVLATLNAQDESSRAVVNANGGVETMTFSNYQITSRDDGTGRTKGATYSDNGYGMVASTLDGLGHVTSYERTVEFGAVTKTSNVADNSFRTVSYSDVTKPFFPTSVTDELGHTTSATRDPQTGRTTRIDYQDGGYETFTFNAFGQVLTHRMTNGASESLAYDARGLKTGWTDGAGKTWTYTYDAADRLASVVDPLQHTTSYQYNERGQLTRTTYNDGTHRDYAYDTYGNRTEVRDELNKAWVFTFDEFNRLLTMKDPLNRTTTYAYGEGLAGGGCSSCTTADKPSSITLPSGKRTVYAYDVAWRRTGVTIGAQSAAEAATTSFGYDAAGNLTTRTDPRGKTWVYAYDKRNRRASASAPPTPLPGGQQQSHVTQWTYDTKGNKLNEQRADGGLTSFEYDLRDRLKKSTDPLTQVTQWHYDLGGRMDLVTDARNNAYGFAYDGRNRKLSISYPGGSHEDWAYDAAGNVVTYTTRASQVKTCTYDTRNRDTGCTWTSDPSSTPSVTTTYDAVGRVLTMNNSNSALSFAYDDAGQLLSETQNVTGGPGAKTVAYTYDLDGNRASLGYPDSASSVAYTYTARNQLKVVTADGPPPLATYTYDLAGNPTAKALEDGTTAAYTYDDANRLTSLVHSQAGTIFVSSAYALSAVNNRTAVTREDGKGDAYAYDATDQLTGAQYDATDPAGTPSAPAKTQGFAYDRVGSRTSASENGTATAYAANALNQYTQVGADTPAYDYNGNLAQLPQASWNYTYDAQNRLVRAATTPPNKTAPSARILTFVYDARNRCVLRKFTLNAGTTTITTTAFVFDGWNLLMEYVKGNNSSTFNPQARYIHGARADELLAKVSPTGTVFYHQDGLGSTVALTDSNGTVVERYRYDAYGAPRFYDAGGAPRSGNITAYGNRFLFTGREWMAEVGLHDYRNRVYAPGSGRFLQTDPIRFAAGDINLYRYVQNNPANSIDPNGLIPERPKRFTIYECSLQDTRSGKTKCICTYSCVPENYLPYPDDPTPPGFTYYVTAYPSCINKFTLVQTN